MRRGQGMGGDSAGGAALADELRATFLFETLSDEQLRWLAGHAEVTALDAGARFMAEGEPVAALWVLLAGQMQFSRHAGGREIIIETSEQPGSSHKLRGVTVAREYDRSLPRVWAHGSDLNQVWTNLIDNAIDALTGAGASAGRASRPRSAGASSSPSSPSREWARGPDWAWLLLTGSWSGSTAAISTSHRDRATRASRCGCRSSGPGRSDRRSGDGVGAWGGQ